MASDETVARVLAEAPRRVIVVGAVDVGKSSFCLTLIAAALEHGRPAALLDSDVGQKMVGPPTAVTCSEAGRTDRLSQLAFVGTTDPVRGFSDVVRGTGELARGSGAELTVVNTSGLLAGAGRRLKAEKVRAVRPDLIVALGDDPALQPILSDQAALPVLHLKRRPGARRKTEGERRAARREAFRSYFATARPRDLTALEPSDVQLIEGQLLGLRSVDGRDLALGIAMTAGPGPTLRVFAPEIGLAAAHVVPGKIALDAKFEAVPLPPGSASGRGT